MLHRGLLRRTKTLQILSYSINGGHHESIDTGNRGDTLFSVGTHSHFHELNVLGLYLVAGKKDGYRDSELQQHEQMCDSHGMYKQQ
jgi:hypothetical protein